MSKSTSSFVHQRRGVGREVAAQWACGMERGDVQAQLPRLSVFERLAALHVWKLRVTTATERPAGPSGVLQSRL